MELLKVIFFYPWSKMPFGHSPLLTILSAGIFVVCALSIVKIAIRILL